MSNRSSLQSAVVTLCACLLSLANASPTYQEAAAPAAPSPTYTSPTYGDFFGEISTKAFQKHGGDFNTFYADVSTSAEGWYLEYWLETTDNAKSDTPALVKPPRHDAADFIHQGGAKGADVSIQCKRTLDATHVSDPKYQGMTFITTRQARSGLLLQLEKEEMKAAARGVPLTDNWKAVRRAFDEGQIPAKTPVTGTPIPDAAELKYARRELEKQWKQLAKASSEWDTALARGMKSSVRVPASLRFVNAKGAFRAVAAGAAVGILLEGGLLWYRVHNGAVAPEELPGEIARSALRVGLVIAIDGVLFALAPTPPGWVVIAVSVAATAVVSAVDVALDVYKDRYGWKPVTIADLRVNHPELGEWVDWYGKEDTARWRAAVWGDASAWNRDWTPVAPTP